MDAQDHRMLMESLDLGHFEEGIGGVVFWHPRGVALLSALRGWMRSNLSEAGYREVETPQLMPASEWERSGHMQFYGAGMFGVLPLLASGDGDARETQMALKPMNCPGAAAVFRHGSRSWRDLPMRLSEFGRCHRMEPSGAMHGLLRLRAFEQDDGHILCSPEDVAPEIKAFCLMVSRAYHALGFNDLEVAMSLRPELRAGTDAEWDLSERLLGEAARAAGLSPADMPGEGAFYGPKLEFSLKDRAGRRWQCGTVQLDLILPGRLGLHYTGQEGDRLRPVMLHRAVLGSLERMVGILLEQHGAQLPPWLAPEQVVVLPVGAGHVGTAMSMAAEMRRGGLRASCDPRGHLREPRLGTRVRAALQLGVPAVAVVGDREASSGALSLSMSVGGTPKPQTIRKQANVREVLDMPEWIAPPIIG